MRIKREIKIIINCIITIGITVAFLANSTNLFERKSSDFKYKPFFDQEEDFDVLFMGTSHVINGIFPMELWNDYGIVSYNFGGHTNQLATTYWVLQNALDYTKPKLVVIDCYYLSSKAKISPISFSYMHLSLDAFPFSKTKVNAVLDLVDDEVAAEILAEKEDAEPQTNMGLLWNYSAYHNRWNELKKDDFDLTFTKEKGAEARIKIRPSDEIKRIPIENKMDEDNISVEYLNKMIEDCQNRGIDVLLTYLPFPVNENQQKEANRIYDIAEQYGVNYIDFVGTDIVNYKVDYCDTGHLNPSGAKKVTDFLGKYIVDHYNIPDQRLNEVYYSWYEDYKRYKTSKLKKLKDQDSLDLYLMLLSDKNYSSIIAINSPSIWENEYYVNLFENLGVNRNEICANTDLLIIEKVESEVEHFENFYNTESRVKTVFGEIAMIGGKESGTYKMFLDDDELYVTTLGENEDVRIVLIDNETMEIVDNVSFLLSDGITTIGVNR